MSENLILMPVLCERKTFETVVREESQISGTTSEKNSLLSSRLRSSIDFFNFANSALLISDLPQDT